MKAYYNENDKAAAAWLRELIKAGVIADGDVDERSILEVKAEELEGYRQCHFFAGIGGWSFALRLAGVGDDEEVWTGSCPCQPFSSAGKQQGTEDERHLWPKFYELIKQCRPRLIFGEQVCSAQVIGHKGKGPGVSGALPKEQSRAGSYAARTRAGAQAEFGFRLGETSSGVAGEDRPGGVRNLRDAVQSGRRAHLGQPIVRPGEAGAGLSLQQYPGGNSRGEQRDGGLGRGEDATNRAFDHGAASERLQCALRAIGEELDEANRSEWFSRVCSDLEQACYAVAASDIPSAGVGAPNIRQRIYWLADADRNGRDQDRERGGPAGRDGLVGNDVAGGLEHAKQPGLEGQRGDGEDRDQPGRLGADAAGSVTAASPVGRMADAEHHDGRTDEPGRGPEGREANFWSDFDLLPCTDGKARRVESGTFPLAHGVSGRVGLLRGYGNAINPWVAALFIKACRGEIK